MNTDNLKSYKLIEKKDLVDIASTGYLLKHIKSDEKLVEKYKKFKFRASIYKDPNKKQCPETDCESYLEKSSKT